MVNFTFVEEGVDVPVSVPVGQSLLEAAQSNEVDLEGACDGALACSTCHLVLEEQVHRSAIYDLGGADELGDVWV